jgi:two-component system chemotaxis sensor kinase CheA
MDLEKYRRLFVDEANDHLVEMSQALTTLEGGAPRQETEEAIDTLFRMAHSIKGMAASLDYGAVASLAHRLEDWMEPLRWGAGQPEDAGLGLVSKVLRGLEQMVTTVDSTGEAPDPRADLVELLTELPTLVPFEETQETPGKKARTSPSLLCRDRCAYVPKLSTAFSLRWAN